MNNKKLERWAEELLDTGKRNNLMNFKTTKAGSAEVVFPDAENFFEKCLSSSGASFEVYDPKISVEEDEEEFDSETEVLNAEDSVIDASDIDDSSSSSEDIQKSEIPAETENPKASKETNEAPETIQKPASGLMNKNDYIEQYSPKVRKSHQILIYALTPNPLEAMDGIAKKARAYLEETGVNVAYLAFGFVHWKEREQSEKVCRAPLLLLPITIKRESTIKPYYIEVAQDEIVVNPTFSFFLNALYGVSLPEYEDEETFSSYLQKVGEIVSKLGWEVSTECQIGIFSFLKINMYNDLMNHEDRILANTNVRLLLGEPVETPDPLGARDLERLENGVLNLHTVVDADSSQIEAIEMVKSGRSFVLQGPPGTGKSQTITNIIAECLHDGKKVLFVSEKLAALNVVYDKLKAAGLSEFCLELHSHKANKSDVIAELCKTLRADRSAVSSRADAEVLAKVRLQEQLDSYAEELHKEIPGIGKSLYALYEAHSAFRTAPDLEFTLEKIGEKDEFYLNEAVGLLKQYEEYLPTIGTDYRKNVWYGYHGRNLSREAQNKLKNDLQTVTDGLQDLLSQKEACEAEYALSLNTIYDAEQTILLLNLLSQTELLRPAALSTEYFVSASSLLELTRSLENLSKEIRPLRAKINESFEENVYQLDGKDYSNKLTKLYSEFFSRMFAAEYKSIIKEIRLASRSGKKPSYEDAVSSMKALADLQDLTARFEEEKQKATGLLRIDRITADTDFDRLTSELDLLRKYFENIGIHGHGGLSENVDETGHGGIRDNTVDYGTYNNSGTCGWITSMTDEEFESSKPKFALQAKTLAGSLERFKPNLVNLQNDFDASEMFSEELSENHPDSNSFGNQVHKGFGPNSFEDCRIPALQSKLSLCLSNMDQAENWIRFHILIVQLESRDLLPFVHECIAKEIPTGQVADTYQRLFYKEWIDHVICENDIFSGFTRISQDRAVEQFGEKDRLQFEISKAQIRAELSAKRPSLDMMAGGSAVSIILREGEKKRRQKNIRKLLEETGDLIQVIKPCFLMSPLSVSTFLNDNSISFDTVVFDEASQIFPQDAVGAIYRGKQLIVVGDSKQMPPSNFFNSSVETEEENEEAGDVTDFESILDLCSVSLPQKRLRWHYRSRYEQLITFSNKNFYENSLVSFPSATTDRPGIGVDYYHVDGLFDRKSHTNRKEAEFIVDLIFRNAEEYPKRSLGVVAFSVAQQELIDRLLSKRRQADPSKEWFFAHDDSKREPFFIKNLETVQGDERDTIIFSVAYGKDAQGRLLHNFGPLNRVGGERRLNVAVTRAKENVQLVSSMHATDIDLTRTSAEGARLLREYLDYAENGEVALERAMSANPFEQYDSEFEQDVCEFLRDHGFTVDTQVGCSGFRIDMGLRKPDSSDYVLAIECDGATYHASPNARDRDRLRQEILERMGWKFYRIWSTDWFRNNSVEKERLLTACTEALHLAKATEKRASKAAEEHAAKASEEADNIGSDEGITAENNAVLKSASTGESVSDNSDGDVSSDQRVRNDEPQGDSESLADNLAKETTTPESEAMVNAFERTIAPKHLVFPEYQIVDVMELVKKYPERSALIRAIVEVEAPISEEYLLKRILFVYGKDKLTSAVKDLFERDLYYADRMGITRKNGFLYISGQNKYVLRVPGEKREFKYIATEELAAGLLTLLKQNITAEKDGLYKTLINQLGFARMSPLMTDRLDEALSLLKSRISVEGNVVSMRQG